jgi:hypothetical protein
VEVLIDSLIVKPTDIKASPTATLRGGDPSTNLLDIAVLDASDMKRNAYVFTIPRIGPQETIRWLLSRSPVQGVSERDKHEAKLSIKSYSQEPVEFESIPMQLPTLTEIAPAKIVLQDIQLKPLKLGEPVEITLFMRNAGGKPAVQHGSVIAYVLGQRGQRKFNPPPPPPNMKANVRDIPAGEVFEDKLVWGTVSQPLLDSLKKGSRLFVRVRGKYRDGDKWLHYDFCRSFDALKEKWDEC